MRNLARSVDHIGQSHATFTVGGEFPPNFRNRRTWPAVNSFTLPPMALAAAAMIHLTRLNNTKLVINSDLIKFVEQSPDTVITLLSGEKILVQETVDEVVERVSDFRRQLLSAVVSWTGSRAGQFPVTCTPAQLQKESER